MGSTDAGGDDATELRRYLTPDGDPVEGVATPAIDDDALLAMYEEMRLARRLDERAVSLQRQGRMGTYPPIAGQEAAQIASTHALREDDPVFPTYRENAVPIARGAPIEAVLANWGGHEAGNARLADVEFFPYCITIAGQVPHATGAAWAAKLSADDRVVCCHFGDGATSEGDFHEGLNFAGVFDVPALFFCNNNQWAISVPRERQTASETIAQKAVAYGFPGVRVDGMDPLAVYEVTREAVERARDPAGSEPRPTLIEAVQYRFGAHTTADDPSVYRDKADVDRWKRLDPIPRLESYLRETGRLDAEAIDAIDDRIETTLAEAIDAYESIEADPTEPFEHVYDEPTPRVADQQEYLRRLRERFGDDALTRE